MDSLRPDREDLDQFKSRTKKASKPMAAKKPNEATVKLAKPIRTKSPVTALLVVALMVLSSFFAWAYLEQQSEILVMQEELKGASDFIGRSKLLMARFEGELNVTGSEIEQSGSAVQSKLAFLDGEMRKLWVISNGRNKKVITENTESLALINSDLRVVKRWRAKFEEEAKGDRLRQKAALSSLSIQATMLQGVSEKLDGRVLLLANEVSIIREDQGESLEEVRKQIVLMASLSKQLAESKKAILSINVSRLQLNERVVGMERQINKLEVSDVQ